MVIECLVRFGYCVVDRGGDRVSDQVWVLCSGQRW